MTISRIAVVNRGAAAVRLIHAVRERALELDADLRTIALYADEDRGSLFVREADERYPIGPATVAVPGSDHRLSAYLSLPVMQEALVRSGADAAWVGWGYNAENAEFATMCDDLGITFIGAPADVLRRLRDTINAKRLAEGVGIPVARWSGGSVDSADTARVEAARLGYPVMIKAAAGSGGRGVHDVAREEDLASAFARARDRARALFGDPTVYLEAAVPGARQVEVQLAADRAGTVWALGVRDSSVQRGHRKIFDEAPSPVLTVEQDAWARDAAIRFAREAGFQGVGSVEFLSDTSTDRLLFLEFNARLQAAHPVTEVTTGLDLVELALHLADGGLLAGRAPGLPRSCDRRPAARRGSRPRVRRVARTDRAAAVPRRTRPAGGHRSRGGRPDAAGLRAGPRHRRRARAGPHRGDRPAAACAGRVVGAARGRHHDAPVPASPGRPSGAAQQRRRHGVGRPAARSGPRDPEHGCGRRALRERDPRLPGRERLRARPLLRLRRPRSARGRRDRGSSGDADQRWRALRAAGLPDEP